MFRAVLLCSPATHTGVLLLEAQMEKTLLTKDGEVSVSVGVAAGGG